MSDDERNKALENACGEDGGRRYSIRQVADMFDMEPSTLRYYEDAGLLTNVERTSTGQRAGGGPCACAAQAAFLR